VSGRRAKRRPAAEPAANPPEPWKRCSGCGKESDECLYEANPLRPEAGGARLCPACAVERWPCPVYFVFHAAVPDEVRRALRSWDELQRLRRWFGGTRPFPIHVYHRREAETLAFQLLYDTAHHGSGRPVEPYSYRGWCSYREIVLLWDETETVDSIRWLALHECAHHACSASKMIDAAMEAENANEGRTTYEWKDDVGHEADSEERLVNRVATAHMGGREYARPWWRPRVKAYLEGRPMPPDPHAPEPEPA
jgi:hypothetical protein